MTETSVCYPKWKYHATLAPKLVTSHEEEEALGSEWAETPAAFEKKESYHEHMAQWESKSEKKTSAKKKKEA